MAAINDLIPDFDDFERYYSGEMSSAEQHALEGRMLAEPLVAEAYEGFLTWRAQHADVMGVRAELRGRLHTRMTQARRNALPLWAYASAASVLLALFAYWNVFLRDQNADMGKSAAAEKQEEATLSRPEQEALPAPIKPGKPLEPVASVPTESESLIPAKPVPANGPKPAVQTLPKPEAAFAPTALAEEKGREEVVQEVRPETIDIAWEDSFKAETSVAQAAPAPAKALAAPGTAQAVAKSMSARVKAEPSYLHTASKKQAEINHQNVSQELVASKLADGGDIKDHIIVPVDTLAAIPAAGWASYQAYLDKNTGSASTSGQIVVTFIISSTGTLTDIVAKGPQQLQKEAIRIISNGPSWVPARANGMPVSSVGEIQLRFRQQQ